MNPAKNLEEFLAELDDIQTTPGEMAWVPCGCTRRPCEVCAGTGRKLTTLRTEQKVVD